MLSKEIDIQVIAGEVVRVLSRHEIPVGFASDVFAAADALIKENQVVTLGRVDDMTKNIDVEVQGVDKGSQQLQITVNFNGPMPIDKAGYAIAEEVREQLRRQFTQGL